MAIYIDYFPASSIAKAMFNFDAFGVSNFRYSGTITVSTSDNFSYGDYLSISYSDFYGALYTSSSFSGESPWSGQTSANIQEILGIYRQFANINFAWQGDYDVIGTDSTVNPEDLGRARVSDINITWTYRPDVQYAGVSGGNSDNLFFRYTGGAGDIFLNGAASAFGGNYTLDPNTRARQVLMHELGHSLGLSHPHTSYVNGVATLSADYAATAGLGFQELGFAINSAADMYKEYFTIMSYDDQVSILPGSNVIWQAHTPMILDVIALQEAYGQGAGTSGSGNDTIAAGTAGYRTYFDTGGVDTIDMSAYMEGAYLNMGVVIAGAAHLVGVGMSVYDAQNTILNGGDPKHLRWFYGEFENAKGSSWSDVMVGNSMSNRIAGLEGDDAIFGVDGDDWLEGGAGDDTLDGGSGNDVFDWSPDQRGGNDTLKGGPGDDVYVLSSSGDVIVENALEGVDTVFVGFSYSLIGTSLENLRALGGLTSSVTFTGNSWGNVIEGGGGSDTLRGNEGDDYLRGGGGSDTIEGGVGEDTIGFTGRLQDYSVTKTTTGYVTRDTVLSRDGTDAITSGERLEFSNLSVNLTIQHSAELLPIAQLDRVIELYVAFFNRVPDADGLEYWIGQVRSGVSISSIAESFYSAGVHFSSLTGFSATMDNASFVNLIYRNVLGRPDGADAEGLAYWTAKLASGEAGRGTLVSTILDSAHTFKGNLTYGWVADLLDNKILVANTLAIDWGLNYNTSEAAISSGMAIAAAVTPTDTASAIGLVGVTEGMLVLG